MPSVAGFALQTFTLALAADDASVTIDLGFDVIEHGWTAGQPFSGG